MKLKYFLCLLITLFILQILPSAEAVYKLLGPMYEYKTMDGYFYIYQVDDPKLKNSTFFVILDDGIQEAYPYRNEIRFSSNVRQSRTPCVIYELPNYELSWNYKVNRNSTNPSDSRKRLYILEYTFKGKSSYDGCPAFVLFSVVERRGYAGNIQSLRKVDITVITDEEQQKNLGIDTTRDTFDGILAAILK